MARIKRTDYYEINTNPTVDDYVIGTDPNDNDVTKNYRIGDIVGLSQLPSVKKIFFNNFNIVTSENTLFTNAPTESGLFEVWTFGNLINFRGSISSQVVDPIAESQEYVYIGYIELPEEFPIVPGNAMPLSVYTLEEGTLLYPIESQARFLVTSSTVRVINLKLRFKGLSTGSPPIGSLVFHFGGTFFNLPE